MDVQDKCILTLRDNIFHVSFPYKNVTKHMFNLCKLFPEAKPTATGISLPAELYTVKNLFTLPDLLWTHTAKVYANSLLHDTQIESSLQSITQAIVPTIPIRGKKLKDFQTVAVDFSLRHSRNIIAMSPGLGKTLVSLYTIACKVQLKQVKKCLIIIPPSGENTWTNELRCIPQLRANWIRRGMSNPQYVTDAELTIVGHEQFVYHIKNNKVKDDLTKFDMVVIDEPRRLMNKQNITYQLLNRLFAATPSISMLNATPIENNLRELYNQVDFVRPGYLGTWEIFAMRHVLQVQTTPVSKVSQTSSLQQKLSEVVFRRNKEDVASYLPPKAYEKIVVKLTPLQQALYKQYAEQMSDENLLKIITRLQQVCDDTQLIGQPASSAKLDELDNIIPNILAWNSEDKMIIFTQFKTWVPILLERYKEYGCIAYVGGMSAKQKMDIEHEFETNPNVHVMFCTSAAFRSINLPSASYVIKLDNLWCNMEQLEDRAHRLTSTHPVMIVELLTDTPFELNKSQVVKEKRFMQQVVIENLPKTLASGVITRNRLIA